MPHVIQSVNVGHEQPDLLHGAHDSTGGHEIVNLEWLQDNQENSRSKVGQQTAPCQADGHTGSGDERGQAGRLDAEESEDGDDQDDVEGGGDRILDIANKRGVNLLTAHTAPDNVDG